MLTPIRALSAGAAVALLAAGCSGDGERPEAAPSSPAATLDRTAARDGLVALWVGDDSGPDDTATGECFADALLAAATAEQLRDAGILDSSYAVVGELPLLDETGATLWVDAQLACTDLVEESTRAQVAATRGKVDRAAYAACLRVALTEEEQRAALVQSVMGDLAGDAVAALSRAQLACAQQALPPHSR